MDFVYDDYYETYNEGDEYGWGEDQGMEESEDVYYPGPSNNHGFNMQHGRRYFRGGRHEGRPPRFYGPPPGLMGPPGPPLMWGRGFGPGGPPVRKPIVNKALRYLMRCGVPKEYLHKIPQELLQLITPEYCGICGHSFDSFQTSRLHYISKNHLKSHKKWLSQQSDRGFQHQREIPFKARELYCELCDVHITSKTHADSHYSGKPHRAIVEGRKNPKNPFLLQPGTRGRLEQLIRREKKNLKPVANEAEEVQETEKVTKGPPPELYCDVCKTSVTCTEQMTMHLNGKRHLAKEKFHILTMMKGGADKASPPEQSAPNPESMQEEDWASQW